VETRVAGRLLQPGSEYFYRFETRDRSSPVGRFRTPPPPDSREPLRIAFFSCQDWQAGFYGAHRVMASEDVDLALCLGDYIYSQSFFEGARRDTLGANGDSDVQTLPEYRAKYRLYRSDPDLQAMHAAHPFMAIWDDHEVVNNYAGDHDGDQPGRRRVSFAERRRNAYRAFYEYMPFAPVVGRPEMGSGLYRRLRLGRLAELFLLDERQFRADQPCNDAFFAPCPEAESEPREFLGAGQSEWLKRSLERSDATWKLVANQVLIMSLDTAPGQPIAKDTWDGYGVERRDLLGHVERRGVRNVSFLTGDVHTFFAADVGVDGRGPASVATEFVGGSITSLGIPELGRDTARLPLTQEQYELLTHGFFVPNPHIKYAEVRSRGFGLIEVRPDELRVEFKAVEAKRRSTEARTIGRFRVQSGVPRVEIL
jgi:alkaline phosphatase D